MENINPITVEILLTIPVEKVWDLWTTPEHIKKWNNASADWHTTHAENNLTVGGTFLSRMEAKDGSFAFDFVGTYTEILNLHRIAYVMEDGRKVEVLFSAESYGTKVIENFEPETENTLDLQKSGWQAILNNFKHYAESI